MNPRDVVVPIPNLVHGDLPPVCAKTGEPADTTISVHSNRARDGYAWLWVIFGPLWFLFARRVMSERITAQLPASRAVANRKSAWEVAAILLSVAVLLSVARLGIFNYWWITILVIAAVCRSVGAAQFVDVHHDLGYADAVIKNAHPTFITALHGGPIPQRHDTVRPVAPPTTQPETGWDRR